ncbi:hypothetical protein D3C73_766600 [compost metagenome]
MRRNRHRQCGCRNGCSQWGDIAEIVHRLNPVAVFRLRSYSVVVIKSNPSRNGHHGFCPTVPVHIVTDNPVVIRCGIPGHLHLFVAHRHRCRTGWSGRRFCLPFIQNILHGFACAEGYCKRKIRRCRKLEIGVGGGIGIARAEPLSGVFPALWHRDPHLHRHRLRLKVHKIQQDLICRCPDLRSIQRRGVDRAEIRFFSAQVRWIHNLVAERAPMGGIRGGKPAECLQPRLPRFVAIGRYSRRILEAVCIPVDAGIEQPELRPVIEEGCMLHNMVDIADIAPQLPVKCRCEPVGICAVFRIVGMIVVAAGFTHRHLFAKALIRFAVHLQILVQAAARQRLDAGSAIAVSVCHI